MKIERISDNQIRCILSKNDLMERHLKISELAYGSEKAKELFRDMMEQAAIDFGFETDDIPIMIEAIPTARESIILVITKVEDPEEFEEKFSHLRPPEEEIEDLLDSEENENDNSEGLPDELLECFDHLGDMIGEALDEVTENGDSFVPLKDTLTGNTKKKKKAKRKNKSMPVELRQVFSFHSLEEIIHAAHIIGDNYQGESTVWKDGQHCRYYLFLTDNGKTKDFKQTCDIISEFGKPERTTYATTDYMNEHFTLIIKQKALLTLSIM